MEVEPRSGRFHGRSFRVACSRSIEHAMAAVYSPMVGRWHSLSGCSSIRYEIYSSPPPCALSLLQVIGIDYRGGGRWLLICGCVAEQNEAQAQGGAIATVGSSSAIFIRCLIKYAMVLVVVL